MHRDNNGLTKEKTLVRTDPLGKDKLYGNSLDFNRSIKIKLTCKKSYQRPKLYFCNMIDSKDRSSIIAQRVLDLKNNDGARIKISDFEYSFEDFLRRNRKDKSRVDKILGLYNVPFMEDAYWKVTPKGVLSDVGGKLPKDTLRLIVEKTDDVWNILIIDPWHHLATERYEKSYQEHKKKYIYGIEVL